jgi:hypothetical protein
LQKGRECRTLSFIDRPIGVDRVADQSAATNWLDVLKAGLWPLLALIAVMVFAAPLKAILTHMSSNLGITQEIAVGPIKIQFSPAAVQSLPPPSEAVAAALTKMDAADIEAILSHHENEFLEVCSAEGLSTDGYQQQRDQTRTYHHLENLALVKLEPNGSVAWCKQGQTSTASLTGLGVDTRRYLYALISRSLVLSKS